MINRVSSKFSIKDLQSISGIKIPTIRMWEKRYEVFKPQRTATNIRLYNSQELRKLLNIVSLQKQGYKISRLALLSDHQLIQKVKECQTAQPEVDAVVNDFILCMLSFDKVRFFSIYAKLREHYAFKELFVKYLIPLLEKIGLLWQTSSILPMHEHFVSSLILQKLHANIDAVTENHPLDTNEENLYVFFLPENEIHELGLLFLYYSFLLENKKVIYLGQNVPTKELKGVFRTHQKIIFVSVFTMAPAHNELDNYFTIFYDNLLQNGNELWVGGHQLTTFIKNGCWPEIKIFDRLANLIP